MLKSFEAIIDTDGQVHLKEAITLRKRSKAIVTILDDKPEDMVVAETALLSEQALAIDWLKPEEEEAWSHLQPEP